MLLAALIIRWAYDMQSYHITSLPTQWVFEPTILSGAQIVAWNTPIGTARLDADNPYYSDERDEHLTVQYQHYFSEEIGAWNWSAYGGYNTRVSFGGMIEIEENTGPAIGYGTFYLRGVEILTGQKYWIQASFFDERGDLPDMFRFDEYTGEAALEAQIDNSDYFTLNPDSWDMATEAHDGARFYGASMSRQQLWDMITDMNAALGLNMSPEPNLHKIFAAGVTPELGEADPGGILDMDIETFFVRTEW